MPDGVEEVLKKIHIMLARCEALDGTPDRVIVSKQEMFILLEELNKAVYDVLDRYEATRRSREMALLEQNRKAAQIEADAHAKADDVQASACVYTDGVLGRTRDMLEETKKSLKHQLIELLAAIEDEQQILDDNKENVREELEQYQDGTVYLELLDKMREAQRKKAEHSEEVEEEQEEEKGSKPGIVIRVNNPGENTGVTYSKRKHGRAARENNGTGQNSPVQGEREDAEAEAPVPKGTVFTAEDFNLDAEYEQWKDEQGKSEGEAPRTRKGVFAGLFGKKKKA
ncbi:MAG: hypothetical protein K6E95_07735 [Lachnospiraceae bacterium]|nr:hypothetical protein [Lachnospiraceae bacterium]